ncbi:hypothetical protein QTO34_007748 [Cnephaeus nilssonii]|uniref:Serine/threonine-protein kinase Sgk3 n=1 Tax=Cnephaeus nilssonii TaxID=3371016 RepID=A0AA40HJ24_CNENI|nr:hypothetical protein QTO34_007748 [Eptesicus nilssonii]
MQVWLGRPGPVPLERRGARARPDCPSTYRPTNGHSPPGVILESLLCSAWKMHWECESQRKSLGSREEGRHYGDQEPRMVYKVLVSVGRSEWFVFRRYAEFDKLYNTLKKQFPTMALKIPAKRIFGDNFDPVQMSERSFKWTVRNTSLIHLKMRMKEVLRRILRFPHPFGPLKHAKPTDFDFLKVIGKGSFGKVLESACNPTQLSMVPLPLNSSEFEDSKRNLKVLLAKRKLDGKFYAVKVLQKKIVLNRREQKHIMAERNVLLKNVKHPFLVGLHYSFQTTEKLYFVLDFVNGGELFFHLQRERSFPEHRARFYAAEIASALGYLHSIKIVYRDLKPENILLDSVGHVVLTDFGLCKEGIAISDTTTTFCGTPEYLAPEVIRKQPYDNTVDWWCLGAVLYEMLYGLPPFYCRDVAEMYDNILHKPLNLRPGVSLTAWSILEELLEKDRQNRLGAKEDFLEIQNHPFFESLSWTDLVQKKIPPPFNPNVDQMILGTLMQRLRRNSSIFCGVSTDYSIVNASVLEADDAFVGFSYAPPSEDLFL